jgi:hypothetical protein
MLLYRAKEGGRNRLELGVANPESPETEMVLPSQDPLYLSFLAYHRACTGETASYDYAERTSFPRKISNRS